MASDYEIARKQALEDAPRDDKGRVQAPYMTLDEKCDEILILLRAFGDAFEAASNNPMLRAMMPAGMFK